MRRDQVENGDVVYSCNCGFIDKGHANPGGARTLWNKILTERHEQDWLFHNDHTIEGAPSFVISYRQGMSKAGVRATEGGEFLIRRGLPEAQKRRVALAIFIEVSKQFEAMQGNWFFGRLTNSGFSPEDLMSNLIGFHRALDGHSMDHMERICGAVSRDASLAVYDDNLAGKDVKVTEFLQPQFYACSECPRGSGQLPRLFSGLRPAGADGSWIRLPGTYAEQWWDGRVLNFDRNGRIIGHHFHRPTTPSSGRSRSIRR
jgi:hypothetical protein